MAFFVAVLFIFFDSLSFEGTCCSACHFDRPGRIRVTLYTLPVYTIQTGLFCDNGVAIKRQCSIRGIFLKSTRLF